MDKHGNVPHKCWVVPCGEGLISAERQSCRSGEEAARSNAKDTKEKVCYVASDFEGSLKEFSENPNKSTVHKLPDGN